MSLFSYSYDCSNHTKMRKKLVKRVDQNQLVYSQNQLLTSSFNCLLAVAIIKRIRFNWLTIETPGS